MPTVPSPRGPLSTAIVTAFNGPAEPRTWPVAGVIEDPLGDDDLHLALYLCYELHYRGFDGVDQRWEWEASLLGWRAQLEAVFEAGLVALLGPPAAPAQPVDVALRALAEDDSGPSLSRYVERRATLAQLREFLAHRSAYQRKEADPHTWAIPRLDGGPKAALVEIQADEYGGGRAERIHAHLFGAAMHALGLDSTYGAYVDLLPGVTLATVNLMSLCGLHRRLRGAIVGHLALFEMTSSIPNRRYANGIRRLGYPTGQATEFFDEHVEADAIHECIAAVDLAGGLAKAEPALAGDIVWGARALAAVEDRWAEQLLTAWAAGRTSLLAPLTGRLPSSSDMSEQFGITPVG